MAKNDDDRTTAYWLLFGEQREFHCTYRSRSVDTWVCQFGRYTIHLRDYGDMVLVDVALAHANFHGEGSRPAPAIRNMENAIESARLDIIALQVGA